MCLCVTSVSLTGILKDCFHKLLLWVQGNLYMETASGNVFMNICPWDRSYRHSEARSFVLISNSLLTSVKFFWRLIGRVFWFLSIISISFPERERVGKSIMIAFCFSLGIREKVPERSTPFLVGRVSGERVGERQEERGVRLWRGGFLSEQRWLHDWVLIYLQCLPLEEQVKQLEPRTRNSCPSDSFYHLYKQMEPFTH